MEPEYYMKPFVISYSMPTTVNTTNNLTTINAYVDIPATTTVSAAAFMLGF